MTELLSLLRQSPPPGLDALLYNTVPVLTGALVVTYTIMLVLRRGFRGWVPLCVLALILWGTSLTLEFPPVNARPWSSFQSVTWGSLLRGFSFCLWLWCILAEKISQNARNRTLRERLDAKQRYNTWVREDGQ